MAKGQRNYNRVIEAIESYNKKLGELLDEKKRQHKTFRHTKFLMIIIIS